MEKKRGAAAKRLSQEHGIYVSNSDLPGMQAYHEYRKLHPRNFVSVMHESVKSSTCSERRRAFFMLCCVLVLAAWGGRPHAGQPWDDSRKRGLFP